MPTSKDPDALQLETVPQGSESRALSPSPINILESAIRGGVTQENVSVVKELIAMCREQRAEDAKAAFARAFFQLRKNMPEIYADKEATDDNGKVLFISISETEISKKLEPHLMAHGFAMLFGQENEEGRITVNVTLMHEAGHSETREYSVRPGKTNRVKDDTMADAGAATTAWRHLMIKMFGLKSRNPDMRHAGNLGAFIGRDKIQTLQEQMAELGGDALNGNIWLVAGVPIGHYDEVTEAIYPVIMRMLNVRRSRK